MSESLQRIEGYDAFIFDMDGTLVDSMPLHLDAWEITANEFGLPFNREQLQQYGGIPTRKIVAILAEKHGVTIDIEAFAQRKIALYLSNIHKVKVFPAMSELVKRYHGKIAMGIGTGSPRDQVEHILSSTGLSDYISVVVSADDVVNHKPHPDTFLSVAQQLQIEPVNCLVFEDTDIGIQAGTAAGMATVLVSEGKW